MSRPSSDNVSPLLSIGAVSAATGVPENTLRTWERRYGWPVPDRTSGRHRLYEPEVVERLRLVARALEQGHRPAQILGATRADLERLIGAVQQVGPVDPDWLAATRALDRDALDGAFRRAHATHGLVRFLEERVGPFLVEIGLAWERGALRTYHEHFASELLRDFLAESWRPLAERAGGPVVVLATLPGETHALGLHMAAAVLALAGCRPLFLGVDIPLSDLRDAVAASGARAVVVSLSAATDRTRSRADLGELRRLLPPEVTLVAGGAGAPPGVDGVLSPASLAELASAVTRN